MERKDDFGADAAAAAANTVLDQHGFQDGKEKIGFEFDVLGEKATNKPEDLAAADGKEKKKKKKNKGQFLAPLPLKKRVVDFNTLASGCSKGDEEKENYVPGDEECGGGGAGGATNMNSMTQGDKNVNINNTKVEISHSVFYVQF